jgi:RimJ/RimL family protein N-acetyltransferase
VRTRAHWGPPSAGSAAGSAVALGGPVSGWPEESTPEVRCAIRHDGRGPGCDAIRTLVRYLLEERGHHRPVIDPAADNAPAISCYRAVGFRPVGQMKPYERDANGVDWHDGPLMELVIDETPIHHPNPDHSARRIP